MGKSDPHIQFEVKGDPVPKQSYRHSVKGGYIPDRVRSWQDLVTLKAKEHVSNLPGLLEGDLYVTIHFWLGHKRRVDLDNLSKAVLDALNGIVWEDDRQITSLHLSKSVVDKVDAGIRVFVNYDN